MCWKWGGYILSSEMFIGFEKRLRNHNIWSNFNLSQFPAHPHFEARSFLPEFEIVSVTISAWYIVGHWVSRGQDSVEIFAMVSWVLSTARYNINTWSRISPWGLGALFKYQLAGWPQSQLNSHCLLHGFMCKIYVLCFPFPLCCPSPLQWLGAPAALALLPGLAWLWCILSHSLFITP